MHVQSMSVLPPPSVGIKNVDLFDRRMLVK